jgi:hypothetical protein
LQKILQKISADHPAAFIYAFMDDITLVGRKSDIHNCLTDLIEGLKSIGLVCNTNKSIIVASEPSTATEFCFKHAPSGAKLLGGFVGDGATEFLNDRLEKSRPFLDRLAKLPTDVSIAILGKCGVPRWNHLCRVTPPAEMRKPAEDFDQCVVRAFEKAACLPMDSLNPTSRTILHLPVQMGGMGIVSFAKCHELLYLASKAGKTSTQKALCRKLNTDLFNDLPVNVQQHMRRCKRERILFVSAPTQNTHLNRVLQYRTMSFYSVADGMCCHCGFGGSISDVAMHALGCVRLPAPNSTSRSSAVKDAIHKFCRSNAIPASNEPIVYVGADGSHKRADLRISLPEADLYLDVVIANGSAKSHSRKSTRALESEKTTEKEAKYLRHVREAGAQFSTFFVESMGEIGSDAKDIIKRLELAAGPTSKGVLRGIISNTLHRQNGAILSALFRSSTSNPDSALNTPFVA